MPNITSHWGNASPNYQKITLHICRVAVMKKTKDISVAEDVEEREHRTILVGI
jgi:hypothetical protein